MNIVYYKYKETWGCQVRNKSQGANESETIKYSTGMIFNIQLNVVKSIARIDCQLKRWENMVRLLHSNANESNLKWSKQSNGKTNEAECSQINVNGQILPTASRHTVIDSPSTKVLTNMNWSN